METIICSAQQFDFNEAVPAGLSIRKVSEENGINIYDIILDAPEETGNFSFVLRYQMQGIMSAFTPTIGRDRSVQQRFGGSMSKSNIYFGAPVIVALQDGKQNAVTVSLSDAVNDNSIRFYVNDFDEQEKIEFEVSLLTGAVQKKQYQVQIRIDTRDVALETVMKDVSDWWKTFYTKWDGIPNGAEDPLYSTWYNFHQHPSQEKLLAELKRAAEVGFKTVILDDGWQFDGIGNGDYSLCGNWQVSKEKFPDFRQFIDDIHGLGMKMMLWFSLPFMGCNNPDYESFKDRFLYYNEPLRCGVLDPRYASVREHIIGILCDYVTVYNLDGFKLDFFDSLRITPETPPVNDKMDEPDLSLAVIRLLSDVKARLEALKPGLLFEYRQNYVGPAMNQFGNMLRVLDCAFDAQSNRIGMTDLRLLHYDLAIHSDMLYWAKTETPENCARQLINTMFSVPQISVLLTECPKEQLDVIRYYLEYWTAHREMLLHEDIHPSEMDFYYPVLETATEELRIVALYLPGCVKLDERSTHVFNATGKNELLVDNKTASERKGMIYDCFGKGTPVTLAAQTISYCPIPSGGHLELE